MRITLSICILGLLLTVGCQSAAVSRPDPSPALKPVLKSDLSSSPPPASAAAQPPPRQVTFSALPDDLDPSSKAYLDWLIFCYEPVYFAYDSFALPPEAGPILERKVAWINSQDPALQVQVTGHADERGSEEYNKVLGALRAHAIKQYLVDRGIAFERIRIESGGELHPMVEGRDETAWSYNRRAEAANTDRLNRLIRSAAKQP